jgi:hypothetical protein
MHHHSHWESRVCLPRFGQLRNKPLFYRKLRAASGVKVLAIDIKPCGHGHDLDGHAGTVPKQRSKWN